MTIKFFLLVLPLFLLACGQKANEQGPQSQASQVKPAEARMNTHFSWTGTINKKISVFLAYVVRDSLIAGDITYLNTKEKKPIKILGTIEKDSSYRLLEFEPSGNISGILTGSPKVNTFTGTWFSPKTRKELELNLRRKDTTNNAVIMEPSLSEIFGKYHYQYSEEGYQGDFEIKKLPNKKVVFNIFSVTGAPGRNIAEIPSDTVDLNANSFIYKLAGSDTCEFKCTFYRDFVTVNYTKGYCEGQFGWNATVDGIFLKTNK